MASFTGYLKLAFATLLCVSAVQSEPCSKPSVRREWNTLSEIERSEWIDAVKCLDKLPHDESWKPTGDPEFTLIPPVTPDSTFYDDITYLHMDLNLKIHFTGLFLPWHRAYMYHFEKSLKEKCSYTGTQPYWDWSLHTEDFLQSPIFDPSPTSGMGGFGTAANDFEVTDGAFQGFFRAYPSPHNLRRNFTIQDWPDFSALFSEPTIVPADPHKLVNTSFDATEVTKLVDGFVGDYQGFQAYFEWFQGAHASVHTIVGADLLGSCPQNASSTCVGGMTWSPNDPLFFLHHSMVDKVWYDWQNRHPQNFWSFHGGSVPALQTFASYNQYPNGKAPYLNYSSRMPFDGLFEEPTVYEMLDTKGGTLCYIYE